MMYYRFIFSAEVFDQVRLSARIRFGNGEFANRRSTTRCSADITGILKNNQKDFRSADHILLKNGDCM